MDASVLKNFFGDPYTTNIGFSPEGLLVQKMAKPPAPTVMFGPQRFQVQCPTLEETAEVFGKLRQEAYTRTNQQIPLLAQVGLNAEHEFTDSKFKPSDHWLATRYIRKGLFQPTLELEIEAQTITFILALTDPPRKFNVSLQPRAQKNEAVFAAINDHREWHKAMPEMDEVATLMRDSMKDIDNRVTPLILGGVAENA